MPFLACLYESTERAIALHPSVGIGVSVNKNVILLGTILTLLMT